MLPICKNVQEDDVKPGHCLRGCYDNKEGHLPAHSVEPAVPIFPYVRVETDFASFFSRQVEGKFSSTLVWADIACLAGTAEVSDFIIIAYLPI